MADKFKKSLEVSEKWVGGIGWGGGRSGFLAQEAQVGGKLYTIRSSRVILGTN